MKWFFLAILLHVAVISHIGIIQCYNKWVANIVLIRRFWCIWIYSWSYHFLSFVRTVRHSIWHSLRIAIKFTKSWMRCFINRHLSLMLVLIIKIYRIIYHIIYLRVSSEWHCLIEIICYLFLLLLLALFYLLF